MVVDLPLPNSLQHPTENKEFDTFTCLVRQALAMPW